MIKSAVWYIKFIFTLMLRKFDVKKAKRILSEKGQEAFDSFCYDVTTKWAFDRIKDSGAKIEIHNLENIPKDKNVLFVSNHQSDFDIAIFMGLIPKNTGFVAKVELQKIPFLSEWMRYIHCVFMDRRDMKQSLQTILDGIKNLKEGYSMVVFPEGTRSKSEHMGEFKPGSFKLATKSKVPIVPVTINGSYKIMEGNHYLIRPAYVDVTIHEPIFLEMLSKEELSGLAERVEETVRSGLK